MSLCPSCGKELSAEESTAKFCTYCGAPLVAENAEVNNETVSETPNTENAVVSEAPVSETTPNSQPEQANKINIDVDEIKEKFDDVKEKALPMIDQLFEKLKGVPVIGPVVEKIDKKLYPVVLAAPVALIVLLLVVIIAVSSSGGYMDPMNDYIKLVNKKSTDYVKLQTVLKPDFRAKLLKDMYNTDIESLEDSIEDSVDAYEDRYDELDDEFDKWKIGFKVKEKEKLDKDDLEDMEDYFNDYFDDYMESYIDQLEDTLDDDDELEDFADSMDISEKEAKSYIKKMIKYYESYEDVKISAAYEVKGKFTIKADKDDWESETVRVIFVKINGDWAYAGLDDGGSITFDDDDEEIYLFNSLFNPLEENHAR